jgi:hypothetical protein
VTSLDQTSFDQTERRLRSAIEQRQFDVVPECLEAFRAQVDARLAALPKDSAERTQLLRHVNEVLEWARLLSCTARAGYADQMRQVSSFNCFLSRAPRSNSRFHIDL